jgi:hypothetical protein
MDECEKTLQTTIQYLAHDITSHIHCHIHCEKFRLSNKSEVEPTWNCINLINNKILQNINTNTITIQVFCNWTKLLG